MEFRDMTGEHHRHSWTVLEEYRWQQHLISDADQAPCAPYMHGAVMRGAYNSLLGLRTLNL